MAEAGAGGQGHELCTPLCSLMIDTFYADAVIGSTRSHRQESAARRFEFRRVGAGRRAVAVVVVVVVMVVVRRALPPQ